MRLISFRNDILQHEERSVLSDHGADVREDLDALGFFPVMEDVLHQVSVSAGGDFFEKASGLNTAAILRNFCLAHDVRQIVKHAGNCGIAIKNRREKLAASTAHVDD